ncbi:MAG: hypothetical protein MN733_38955, partial [Nitrososphaera sp.]|nr:hypothetical protein [Nitrososphaera sp.]
MKAFLRPCQTKPETPTKRLASVVLHTDNDLSHFSDDNGSPAICVIDCHYPGGDVPNTRLRSRS